MPYAVQSGLLIFYIELNPTYLGASSLLRCPQVKYLTHMFTRMLLMSGLYCVALRPSRVLRSCQFLLLLLGIPGNNRIPLGLDHTKTLDVFQAFYINKFADHHAHEMVF